MTLQQLLGTELPIIQAPMAGVQGSALAVAVSNAGGLGSLPCAMLSPDAMRSELAAIRAQTAKPFNVNFFCHTPPAPEPSAKRPGERRSRRTIASSASIRTPFPPRPGERPSSAEAADVLDEFKPAVVSFHFGLPSPELLARVRSRGSKILSSATTVDEARWLEAHGVDAIIAQGLEAGGHRGMFLSDDLTTQVGTFALVPQIVQAVKVPVIAAGGIADARGVAAAMALGAAGVQVGTAYLLCPEATTSARASRGAQERGRPPHGADQPVHRPARAGNRQPHHERARPHQRRVPAFPLAAPPSLRCAPSRKPRADDFSPLWSGQNNRDAKRYQPVP